MWLTIVILDLLDSFHICEEIFFRNKTLIEEKLKKIRYQIQIHNQYVENGNLRSQIVSVDFVYCIIFSLIFLKYKTSPKR